VAEEERERKTERGKERKKDGFPLVTILAFLPLLRHQRNERRIATLQVPTNLISSLRRAAYFVRSPGIMLFLCQSMFAGAFAGMQRSAS